MIKVNEISVRRGDVLVLQNFSALVPEVGATLLSGPNGSGKTTLIHAIAGSLPLESGSVEISDRNISMVSAGDLAQLRSVAPQRRIFTLSFSVAEILSFVPTSQRNEHWQATIESLGLNELMQKKVTELSVGQQQRVSVALALIQDSHFYLLDEPLSAQDSEFQLRILSAIKIIATKKGVLVVSHNTDSLHSQFDQELRLN
jgi:ABC-type cobalamin/Fe3+-siderophores transport system ATPase subunit